MIHGIGGKVSIVGVAVAVLFATSVWNSYSWRAESLEHDQKGVEGPLERARGALKDKIRNGGLRSGCCSTSTKIGCALGEAPNILTIYFMVQAMGERLGDDLTVLLDNVYGIEKQGKWSYTYGAPLDADVSAYALLALHHLGFSVDVEPMFDFYIPHTQSFVTFNGRLSPGKEYEIVPEQSGFAGDNLMIHPEVNINVFRLLKRTGFGDLVNYELVADSFSSEGFVSSFYYPSKYFGTWLAIDLVGRMEEFEEKVDRAVQYIAKTQNTDGSWGEPGNSWDTALAINALICAGYKGGALDRGVQYLLAVQHDDGMWHTDSVIWVYPFDFRGNRGTWLSYDSSGVLTTSLVVIAFDELKRRI